jgi:hypothetical protein
MGIPCRLPSQAFHSTPAAGFIGAAGPVFFQSIADVAHPAGWMLPVKTGRCESSLNRCRPLNTAPDDRFMHNARFEN